MPRPILTVGGAVVVNAPLHPSPGLLPREGAASQASLAGILCLAMKGSVLSEKKKKRQKRDALRHPQDRLLVPANQMHAPPPSIEIPKPLSAWGMT